MPDQPVFCEDRVRYTGDAVATAAEEGLAAVVVEYEPMPVLDSVDKALNPGAEQLHEMGNIRAVKAAAARLA